MSLGLRKNNCYDYEDPEDSCLYYFVLTWIILALFIIILIIKNGLYSLYILIIKVCTLYLFYIYFNYKNLVLVYNSSCIVYGSASHSILSSVKGKPDNITDRELL